jgi:hypothetical protein
MKPPPIRDQSESPQISQSQGFFSKLLELRSFGLLECLPGHSLHRSRYFVLFRSVNIQEILTITYVTVYLGLINFKRFSFVKGADYSYGIYLYGFAVQQHCDRHRLRLALFIAVPR